MDSAYDILAEGNPDEEKIGAFGVGQFQLGAVISAFNHLDSLNRFLQSIFCDRRTYGNFRRSAFIHAYII